MQTQKLFRLHFSNPLMFSVGHNLENVQIIAINKQMAFEKLRSYMCKKGYAIAEADIDSIVTHGESVETQDCLPMLFFID